MRKGEIPGVTNTHEARANVYTRIAQGYTGRDLVRELALLRMALIDFVMESVTDEPLGITPADRHAAMRILNLYLDEEMRYAITVYCGPGGGGRCAAPGCRPTPSKPARRAAPAAGFNIPPMRPLPLALVVTLALPRPAAPQSADAEVRKGVKLTDEGDYDEAIVTLDAAVRPAGGRRLSRQREGPRRGLPVSRHRLPGQGPRGRRARALPRRDRARERHAADVGQVLAARHRGLREGARGRGTGACGRRAGSGARARAGPTARRSRAATPG
jgi:hypothetical protein